MYLEVLCNNIKNVTPREYAAVILTSIVECKTQDVNELEVQCSYTFNCSCVFVFHSVMSLNLFTGLKN
jgi:hypothetical protein